MASTDFSDLLALVQPNNNPPTKSDDSTAGGLANVDLASLSEADLQLLQPLMDLLNLSTADLASLTSEPGLEDADEELSDVDDALQKELDKLDEAEHAAGALEGNLDRLLERLMGMEAEVEVEESKEKESDGKTTSEEKAEGVEAQTTMSSKETK